MKKHLLGLAIFSFIVVSFAIAFAILYAPVEICPIRKIEESPRIVVDTDKRKRCDYSKRRFEISTFKVTATLTEKYREFEATIEGEKLSSETEVKLHFFVNDGKGIKYLTTKNSQAIRNYNIDFPTAYIKFKFDEAKQISSKQNNFYVIAEVVDDNSKLTSNPQDFDSNKAVPILWSLDVIN